MSVLHCFYAHKYKVAIVQKKKQMKRSLFSILVLSMEVVVVGRLWVRGRASFLLSEGRWFDSPGPQTAPVVLVGTLHGSHHVYECM